MIKRHINVIECMLSDMDSKLIYLAAPYSNEDNAVVKDRMDKFREAIADLTEANLLVVSPLEKHYSLFTGELNREIASDWNYWGRFSEELMKKCGAVVVLAFDGVDNSPGVAGELELARIHKLPTLIVYP